MIEHISQNPALIWLVIACVALIAWAVISLLFSIAVWWFELPVEAEDPEAFGFWRFSSDMTHREWWTGSQWLAKEQFAELLWSTIPDNDLRVENFIAKCRRYGLDEDLYLAKICKESDPSSPSPASYS